MRIGVFGTGMVGQTIGTKLVHVGHDVRMGSRTEGNANAMEWVGSAGAPRVGGSVRRRRGVRRAALQLHEWRRVAEGAASRRCEQHGG